MNCEFGIEYTAAKTELAMALNSSAKPEESIGVHHNTVEVTSETLPTAGKPPTDSANSGCFCCQRCKNLVINAALSKPECTTLCPAQRPSIDHVARRCGARPPALGTSTQLPNDCWSVGFRRQICPKVGRNLRNLLKPTTCACKGSTPTSMRAPRSNSRKRPAHLLGDRLSGETCQS